MILHFAYGSNMSRELMHARCPGAQALGVAQLDGFRYIITRDGYASVVPSPGRTVHGVLWRLTARDLAALNAYEGVDSGLFRPCWLPVRYRGRRVTALVYRGRSRATGRPRPGYQDRIVLPAARSWNLPEPYVAELSRWAPPFGRNAPPLTHPASLP
ncbi:MAG: gamma-glutamylcyclotransferase [Variibacter sp.]|nr:gamma-glutamylcyclotransferase [Variibacter sp.]